MRSECDDGCAASQALGAADARCGRHAIEVGHVHVHQHQAEGFAGGTRHGVASAVDGDVGAADVIEHSLEHGAVHRMVVCNQDPPEQGRLILLVGRRRRLRRRLRRRSLRGPLGLQGRHHRRAQCARAQRLLQHLEHAARARQLQAVERRRGARHNEWQRDPGRAKMPAELQELGAAALEVQHEDLVAPPLGCKTFQAELLRPLPLAGRTMDRDQPVHHVSKRGPAGDHDHVAACQRTIAQDRSHDRQRHADRERGPHALLALDQDAPAHQRNQVTADRESEPRAAELRGGRTLGLLEGLEYPRTGRRCHADTRIAHRNRQREGARGALQDIGGQRDLSRFGELDRIAYEVQQHLPQPQGIAHQQAVNAGRRRRHELHALRLGLGRQHVDRLAQQHRQVHRSRVEHELAGLDLGQVEDVVEDQHQRTG